MATWRLWTGRHLHAGRFHNGAQSVSCVTSCQSGEWRTRRRDVRCEASDLGRRLVQPTRRGQSAPPATDDQLIVMDGPNSKRRLLLRRQSDVGHNLGAGANRFGPGLWKEKKHTHKETERVKKTKTRKNNNDKRLSVAHTSFVAFSSRIPCNMYACGMKVGNLHAGFSEWVLSTVCTWSWWETERRDPPAVITDWARSQKRRAKRSFDGEATNRSIRAVIRRLTQGSDLGIKSAIELGRSWIADPIRFATNYRLSLSLSLSLSLFLFIGSTLDGYPSGGERDALLRHRVAHLLIELITDRRGLKGAGCSNEISLAVPLITVDGRCWPWKRRNGRRLRSAGNDDNGKEEEGKASLNRRVGRW